MSVTDFLSDFESVANRDIEWGRSAAALKAVRIGNKASDVASASEALAKHPLVSTWTSGGYLAKVGRQICQSCGRTQDHCIGVYAVELGNGGRRLTRLPSKGQFPLEPWPMEIDVSEVEWCAVCLSDLGFTPAVGMPQSRPRTIAID